MSYILDALRKLEREKGRKSGSGGAVNISGDILTGGLSPRREPAGRWRLIAAAVVLVVLACSLTYWLARKPQSDTPSGIAGQRPAVQPVAPPAPQPPAAAVPVPPASVVAPAAPVAPLTTPAPLPVPAQPAAVVREPVQAPTRPKQAAVQQVRPQPPAASAPAKISAPADIKVMGIAWQEERSARMAVINGFLMREGAVVSGAKVTEILADKVRFSSANGQFDVPLLTVDVPQPGGAR